MPVVELVVQLVPGHGDLFGVDHDHEVAGVDMRGVLRFRLAPKRVGDLGRQTAEGFALGVNDVPAALDLARLCVPSSLHGNGGLRVRRLRIVDRKSTRLNSSHMSISYAVFCLKKKKKKSLQVHRERT